VELGFMVASNDEARPGAEADYFYQMMALLKREYVDPVTDDSKLAFGAVKGMVDSLMDPMSLHMGPKEFQAHLARKKGTFEGIGAEVALVYDQTQLDKLRMNESDLDPLLLVPDVVVTAVAPGGPADKAGIKPGDRIERVGKKWLMTSSALVRLRELQSKSTQSKAAAEAFARERSEFQAKYKKVLNPVRARELLTTGAGMTLEVGWTDGKASRSANIVTAVSTVPAVQRQGGTVSLRLFDGAAESLKKSGGLAPGTVIDLRNSSQGDYEELPGVLGILGPSGVYGTLKSERVGEPRTLTVESGSSRASKYTLRVDESTTGAARILAEALTARGAAKLEGRLSGEGVWIETRHLANGNGYTLAVGRFVPTTDGGAK
jgi:carboxyl-terminal processing protease